MADAGTLREPDPCFRCEGWHDPDVCPETGADPFVDADLWEAEAARVNAALIADFGMTGDAA